MPVYNEQGCIRSVIEDWAQFLNSYIQGQFTIIAIDDGSKDNTPQILSELKNQYSFLQVITQENSGHGATLIHGYQEAINQGFEYIFQVDSDDQFMPQDFPLLWEKREQTPFILGKRQKRHDPLHRLVITRILKWLITFVFYVKIPDANIPYRLMKASFLQRLIDQLPYELFAPNIFLAIMAASLKVDLLSIPVRHKSRNTGTNSIVRIRLLKVCFQSFQQLIDFRFNYFPPKH